jgi:hypothetical protein
MAAPLQRELRESIIAMVIATDMKAHFAVVSELQAAVEKKRMKNEWFSATSRSDRLMVLESALHTADLANPSKPLSACVEWTDRIVAEFYVQGDEERKLGIPISLMCDRYKPNVERSQIGFIDAIVKPLYVVFAQIVPELKVVLPIHYFYFDSLPILSHVSTFCHLQTCVDGLAANRAYWQTRVNTQQAAAAASGAPSTAPPSPHGPTALPPPAHTSSSTSSAHTSPSTHGMNGNTIAGTMPTILLSPSAASIAATTVTVTSPTPTAHQNHQSAFRFDPQTIAAAQSSMPSSVATTTVTLATERPPSLLSAALSERAAAVAAERAAAATGSTLPLPSSSTHSAVPSPAGSVGPSPASSRSPSPSHSYTSTPSLAVPQQSVSHVSTISTNGPITNDDDLAFTVGSPVSTFSVHFPPVATQSLQPTRGGHHHSHSMSISSRVANVSSHLHPPNNNNNSSGMSHHHNSNNVSLAPRSPGGSPQQQTRTIGLFAARLAALRSTPPMMTASAPTTPVSHHSSTTTPPTTTTTPPSTIPMTLPATATTTTAILDAIAELPSPVEPSSSSTSTSS